MLVHEPGIRTRRRWRREVPEDVPERPVSSHPNFVTARGLQQIESQIHELEAAREAPKRSEDKDALARVDRDLRYWQQRKATAKLVEPETEPVKVQGSACA